MYDKYDTYSKHESQCAVAGSTGAISMTRTTKQMPDSYYTAVSLNKMHFAVNEAGGIKP